MAINIENVSFSYDKKTIVLKKINLTIAKGKWVAIVGHNGSGKSTLAKLLVGLIVPDEGEITIAGLPLNEDNIAEIRRQVGIVFQNPDNQFVGVTVKHDIAFGLENRQIPQPEMVKLVDKYSKVVGIDNYLDKEPHQLSGGQKQSVAIAGALAMNQHIMIFDEATSMLDPQGKAEISNFIGKLNKQYQKTLLTITHDLEFAKKADEVIVMNEGEIIYHGLPEDVFQKVDVLKAIDLDIPFGLKMVDLVNKDEDLNKNKRLVESLWQYSLKR